MLGAHMPSGVCCSHPRINRGLLVPGTCFLYLPAACAPFSAASLPSLLLSSRTLACNPSHPYNSHRATAGLVPEDLILTLSNLPRVQNTTWTHAAVAPRSPLVEQNSWLARREDSPPRGVSCDTRALLNVDHSLSISRTRRTMSHT